MSRRSRRRSKQSPLKRNWLSITIIAAIIVIAVVGGYVYETRGVSTTTSTSSSTGTSSAGTGEYAVLDTSQGTIVVQLFPQDAPKTVANFVSLANSGFYDNLVWHRIVAGFIIQTGDPNTKNGGGDESTWGQGGSGTNIPFENSGLPEGEGYVAMANTSPQGAGASSQFFINLVNNTSSLGNGYAVFGDVVSGLSVVQAIGNLPVGADCQSSGGLTCPPSTPSDAMLISVTIQSTP
ncbi:MAG: peptidylprolyl isomerase [Thaumarchaeota archaeon]|nr:peptidylprolyl isomerase [Nitrososphaerota archaeon]